MGVTTPTVATPLADRSTDEQAWRAARLQGVGASEVAAVVAWYERRHGLAPLHDAGPPPFTSALAVWARKVGIDTDERASERMSWGQRLEPVIVEAYASPDYSGRRTVTEQRVFAGDVAHLLASPDGWTWAHRDGVERVHTLEVKATGNPDEWADGPPTRYYLQGQAQALVAGTTACTFAAFLGMHHGLAWLDVPADERVMRRIESAVAEFWSHVEARVPPETDGSEATRRALLAMHPEDDGSTIELPARWRDLDAELLRLRAERDDVGRRIAEIENELRATIGSASRAVLPGGPVYSLKRQTRRAYTVAESSTRVLRRHVPKEAQS